LYSLKAAKCLFTASLFLWKTHPAANCFISISSEEALEIDSMRCVKPGNVISFREASKQIVRIGRILRSNTVERIWQVQVDDEESVIDVSCSDLAGIENVARRTTILGHVQAPDSSAAIEAFHRSASLGHLILGLRWCSQFFSESNEQSSLQGEPITACIRLAELLVAILGIEVSIRDEVRRNQCDSTITQVDVCLAHQIFDLLEDVTDVSDHTDSYTGRREGRLKSILHSECWKQIRIQLKYHISMAAHETATNQVSMDRTTMGARSPPKLLQF
jgi:hypothetical protein